MGMINKRHHLWPGVPLALGSAVLFGASAPLSKLLMGSIDPWLLAGILYLGAGFGLAILSSGRRLIGLPNVEAPLQRTDTSWLFLVVLFGGRAWSAAFDAGTCSHLGIVGFAAAQS